MKRLMLGMLAMLGLIIFCLNAKAEEVKVSDLPNAKAGFCYNFDSNELSDAYTTEVLNWKDLSLDAGYYRDEAVNKDTAILALAYKLGGLEKLGINVPLAKYLDTSVGYYVGAERIERGETPSLAHGIYATLIKVAF